MPPPDPAHLDAILSAELQRRSDAHRRRALQTVSVLDAVRLSIAGRTFVNFASNNYLGLTHHPKLIAAVQAAAERGVGAGASPLISGHSADHAVAEERLAVWKGTQASLLLPSGYQAAHAAIQTLAALGESRRGEVRFLADKLVHASLLDAIGVGRRELRLFPHNHLRKLARLLAAAESNQLQVVVTESIFSMDGDAADLHGLAELRRTHPFVLLLDEAHGSGVYGPDGAGYAAEQSLQNEVDVTIVTLSKALGIGGGAICASATFCDAVANWGRAYIYSTALAPIAAAAVCAALDVMRDEPQRQARVRELARRVRAEVSRAGFALPAGDSPIVPIILGDETRALEAAQQLREQGMLVMAIRPPTVPRGASRLRVTLSCEHSDDQVQELCEAISGLRERHGLHG